MAHQFLSDTWFDAVFALKVEYDEVIPSTEHSIVINQTISDVPFGTGTLELSLDTTSGFPDISRGHNQAPDVTVRTDYETAKSVLIGQDIQAIMQAFVSGRILVQGDLAKLMTMQATAMTAEPDPVGREIASRLKQLTDS